MRYAFSCDTLRVPEDLRPDVLSQRVSAQAGRVYHMDKRVADLHLLQTALHILSVGFVLAAISRPGHNKIR